MEADTLSGPKKGVPATTRHSTKKRQQRGQFPVSALKMEDETLANGTL
jgi:hypothetical protein